MLKIKKKKKQTISKALKNKIWNQFIGKEKGIGNCFCCKTDIDSKHFHCGHIIAESKGGTLDVDNLRPVCELCNQSMGNKNMNQFKKQFVQKKPVQKKSSVCKCNSLLHSMKLTGECENCGLIRSYR